MMIKSGSKHHLIGIRSKLLGYFLVLTIIPLTILGFLSFNSGKQSTEDQVLSRLVSIADSKTSEIDGWLTERMTDTNVLSNDHMVKGYLEMLSFGDGINKIPESMHMFQDISKMVENIRSNYGYNRVILADISGRIVASTDKKDISGNVDRVHLEKILFLKEPWVEDIHRTIEGNIVMDFSGPVFVNGIDNDGKLGRIFVGIVVLEMKMEKTIYGILDSLSGMGTSGETLIARKEGNEILFLSNLRHKNNTAMNMRQPLDSDIAKATVFASQGDSGILRSKDYRGVDVLAAYKYIPSMNWGLVAKIDQEEAFYRVEVLRNTIFLSSILIISLAIILALVVANSFTKPIIFLKNSALKISKGEQFNLPKIKSNDEISELTIAFNDMAIDLKKSQSKLKQYALGLEKEVGKRTEQLDIKLEEVEQSKSATINIMEDLSETIEKLKELDKMKLAFLSSISHELRTPLTPIKVQLQRLLTRDLDKKEQKEVLDMILRNSVRLDRLISDLLAVNRIESGRLMIAKRQASLNDVVKDAIQNQSILAKQKGIKIINKISISNLSIDRDRILEIFINLISNAIKYNDKGSIILEAEKQKNNILVTVKDNGIGIPKGKISGLFKVFSQVEPGKVSGSSGMGLFICKGIIEAHGGKIWLTSKLGKGTTFYFTIPLNGKK